MRVDGENVSGNLLRAERAIADAAAKGADLVLLPEALDCGWAHPCARHLAQPVPAGATCERLCRAAANARLYVCAGLVERAENLLFNAAILVSPEGRIVLHHRKIHELDIAADLYAAGNRLSIADTPLFGRLGVMICADAFAPEFCISRALGVMGREVDSFAMRMGGGGGSRSSARSVWRLLARLLWAGRARIRPLDRRARAMSVRLPPDRGQAANASAAHWLYPPKASLRCKGPYGEDAEALLLIDLQKA
jgi:predicted amidohydrolase